MIGWLSGSPCVGCLRHTGVVYTAVDIRVCKMSIAGDCGIAVRVNRYMEGVVLTMMGHADSWGEAVLLSRVL